MKNVKKIFSATAICIMSVAGVQTVSAQGFGMLSQPVPEQKSYQCLAAAGGRYVFGQISDSSKDQFMLDTLTGRLWRISETGTVGLFLQAVPYKNEKGEYHVLPEEPAGR
ncbi:MAG TPA: hypothetical protein ENN79_02485 [Desulfobacteraceae bacterium]|nr:hypothetical protein [Desulfobacteraceae bacterium]